MDQCSNHGTSGTPFDSVEHGSSDLDLVRASMPNPDSEQLPLAPPQAATPAAITVPGTRAELEVWIRDQLGLEPER